MDSANAQPEVVVYRGQEVGFAEAGPEADAEVLAFLQALFERPEYDEAWWRHVRYASPAGRRDYYVARVVKTGEVVGVYGLAPVRLKLGAAVGKASECCNVGAPPGRPGLFQDLSRYALACDAAKGRWLAFCSPRRPMAIRAHRAVGWQTLTTLAFYVKPAQAEAAPPASYCEEVPAFPADVDALLASYAGVFDWTVVKDHAYLNWRYQRPAYRRFLAYDKDRGVQGLLVVKDYVEAATGLKRTHIMECIARDPGVQDTLFRQAGQAALASDELHTWAERGSVQAEALARRGFEENGASCPLLIYPYSAQTRDVLQRTERRHVALGDDEAF